MVSLAARRMQEKKSRGEGGVITEETNCTLVGRGQYFFPALIVSEEKRRGFDEQVA